MVQLFEVATYVALNTFNSFNTKKKYQILRDFDAYWCIKKQLINETQAYTSYTKFKAVCFFNFRFELEDYERATTMKNIILKSEETVSGMKGFIVLGTTYVYGEDLPCKGRVSHSSWICYTKRGGRGWGTAHRIVVFLHF